MNKNEIQDTVKDLGGKFKENADLFKRPPVGQASQGDEDGRHLHLGAGFLAPGDVLDRADYILQTPLGIKLESGQAMDPSHDLIDYPILDADTPHRPISRTCHGFSSLYRTNLS